MPAPPGPAALGQRALRNEVDLELSGQQLPLEFGILAHVARNHLSDLALLEHEPDPEVVDAGVVRNAGQVLHARSDECGDAVFGNAAEPETSEHQGHPVGDLANGFIGCGDDFVHGWFEAGIPGGKGGP